MDNTENKETVKQSNKGGLTLGIAILVVLIGIYLLACASVRDGRILQTTTVNNIDVSGLSKEEAAEKIKEGFVQEFTGKQMKIKAGDTEYAINLIDCIDLDADKAADIAYSFGHKNFLSRGFCLLQAVITGKKHTVLPEVISDEALEAQLQQSGILSAVTTVQTTYQIADEAIIFKKGVTGGAVDGQKLIECVKKNVAAGDYDTEIEAPMTEVAVTETNMETLYNELHKDVANATLNPDKKYKVVESVTGFDFDPKEAQVEFDAAKEGEEVIVPVNVVEPEVTTAQLKKHLFEKKIGSCSVELYASKSRRSNIEKVVDELNDKILLAGEELSFNDMTGKRTEENGYIETSAIEDGAKNDELGGGVCQVAAALYNATIRANLEVTEHHTHTYVAEYLSPGLDAAVSNDADLKIKNSSLYPIQIKAKFDADTGKVTVKIYGAKLDNNKVEFVSEMKKTEKYSVEKWTSKDVYVGDDYTYRDGRDGGTAITYRIISDKDGKEISKDKIDECSYEPLNKVIIKGTKEKATTAATTATQPATAPAANTTAPAGGKTTTATP